MIEVFNSNYLLIGFTAVLGLMIGSFLNVVIHRLPLMLEKEFRLECQTLLNPELDETNRPSTYNLATPRSACPTCGHQIKAIENIPILSWLALKGRCSQCHSKISARYPCVEFATAAISAGLAIHFGPSLQLLGALAFAWCLVALIMIDADTYLLPDSITLPLLWLGLLLNTQGIYTSLPSAVYGATFGYLSLWSIYWLFKLATGKEGMGYGDFKLLAALGAWLGFAMLPIIILLSSLAGAILGIIMVAGSQRGWNKPMPFGPYLGIAGMIAMVWGKEITLMLYGY
ncbi:prepilin peptidase [Chitinibacter bivalviorum]|uniref:Prepilin leader peptidase/N-methyltransferase n=1 Tax=Chitinibacter bivalviorum TaxID=2739434 RepID=A0A7H9BK87_9NEIS|nr:A24 family peptidase [Chitinibacter bivalviorum]QLG88678.1 prepilin peptidase [Chitinibacter bivalviorum]